MLYVEMHVHCRTYHAYRTSLSFPHVPYQFPLHTAHTPASILFPYLPVFRYQFPNDMIYNQLFILPSMTHRLLRLP